MPHPYRLGFAVKVLGEGGLPTADTRRWRSGPHLSRSLEMLGPVLDRLERLDVRMFRLSSQTIPYGTHPDLPDLDYRRQIDQCRETLTALGQRATALGLRLSTHPGQYTVLNSADPVLTAKSAADLEQDTALLDALDQGPEGAVVVHVGGLYGDRPSALDRWARAYETLSERTRARLALENDDGPFGVTDVLELHRRTGVRIAYDHHHHRTSAESVTVPPADALAAAYRTWAPGCDPRCTCPARGSTSRSPSAGPRAADASSASRSPRGSRRTPTSSRRGTWWTCCARHPARSTSCSRRRRRTSRSRTPARRSSACSPTSPPRRSAPAADRPVLGSTLHDPHGRTAPRTTGVVRGAAAGRTGGADQPMTDSTSVRNCSAASCGVIRSKSTSLL
ncbi:hypothetical protein [Cellulomonas sp. ATA003]|uniref:hypothetical protein n=1 Tax=Cellulomonas sp. ATA003 TaxID=3073064 RepID=UPI00287376E8|nr:hypothetical protein [Cellulomonas sp. ATA003]WNB86628.1 hypothetical protein REH70_05195 [Cellulomonas sp. ATA003]